MKLGTMGRGWLVALFVILSVIGAERSIVAEGDVERRIAEFWKRVDALAPADHLSSADLGQWALNVIERDARARITVADFRVSTSSMQSAMDRARVLPGSGAAPPAAVEQRIAEFWKRVDALLPADHLSAADLGQWALNVIERDPSARLTVADFRASTGPMQAGIDRAGPAPVAVVPRPTPRPAAAPPAFVDFRISAGIAQKDSDAVRDGVGRAARFFREVMREDPVSQLTVIVTTFNSPQWPTDTGDTCCGMPNLRQPLVAYAVDHRMWIDGARDGATWYPWIQKNGVHEYAHVWQRAAGCRNNYHESPPEMPIWLQEGGVEWLAFEAAIRDGLISREWAFWYVARENTNPSRPPPSLRDLERSGPNNTWAYQYGAFASSYLLTSRGLDSYARFCAEMRTGLTWQSAFTRAFGLTSDQFYADFEQWRRQYLAPWPRPVF